MARRPVAVMDAARDTVLTAIAEGHTRRAAASLAGIDEDTVRNWEKTDSAFSDRLRVAEFQAMAVAERTLIAATAEDWRAALAYLERRSRPDWGKNQSVELSGPQGGAIPVQFGALTTDELRRLADGPLPSPDSP